MLKTILTYYLSFSVLLATVGINVFEHTCSLFGITESSFVNPKSCFDGQEMADFQVDVPCCALEHEYHLLDTDLKKRELEAFLNFFPIGSALAVEKTDFAIFRSGLSIHQYAQPPPNYNRQLLNFIQVYRL